MSVPEQNFIPASANIAPQPVQQIAPNPLGALPVAAPVVTDPKRVRLTRRDGFSRKAKITSNRHPGMELNITFRPTRALEQVQHDVDCRRANGEGRVKLLVAYIVAHVDEWDILDENGAPAPITAATLELMQEEDFLLEMETAIGAAAWPAETQLGN